MEYLLIRHERTSGYSAARRAASVTLPTACMAAGHPLCGILNAVSVIDEDSFCIQFVHRSASLGTLRLLNSSILDTVSTKLPSHILPNESGWWAVRDGVVWQATGGVKTDSCTVHPFTISAWFGADCLSCPHRVVESPHYRIHLSLTLRHTFLLSGEWLFDTRLHPRFVSTISVPRGSQEGGPHCREPSCRLCGAEAP